MIKSKRFKDPIYGYIDIDEAIISNIVDTAGFQRLRNIIQTSYSPLYSSAVHNRFVHSLGVYHLGCIVAESVARNKDTFLEIGNIQRHLEIFELACLLHVCRKLLMTISLENKFPVYSFYSTAIAPCNKGS